MKFKNNYDKINRNLKNPKTDINYIIKFIMLFIKFILLLPFRILGVLFFLIFNSKKQREISKNISNDFKEMIKLLFMWFFEAQIIVFIIVLMIFSFLLQIFVLDNYGVFFAHKSTDLLNFERVYTFITSIFLHGGLYHLLGNLFALFVFGRSVEKYLKKYTFWFFLGVGIFANLVCDLIYLFLLNDNLVSWGASGSIAGLIMFVILVEPFKFTFFFGVPLPHFLIGWFLIYTDLILISVNDGVSHYVHLAGYFSILIFMSFLKSKYKNLLQKGLFINLVMIFLLFFLYLIFPDIANISNYYNTFLDNLKF